MEKHQTKLIEMIQTRKEEGDFVAESEEDTKKSGADGDWSATDAPSGGDEETCPWHHQWH